MRRPHAVYVNPWDPQKHVWIVDDHSHAVFKMTNDGKQIVMTLGTPNKKGADGTHFNRPTFLAFLPDSSVFVADGYNGNRVAKFDKDGKFLWTSGMPGMPGGRETRPGYFNTVHGIAADPMTRRVYVSDRSNRRIQVLDGDSGKPVDWWPVGDQTNLQFLIIPADRSGVWGFTDTTAKIAKWDFNGRLLYSWGVLGDFPGVVPQHARRQHRPGRQPLHRRSRRRARAEVPPAPGREPRVSRGCARLSDLEIVRGYAAWT